MNKSRSAMWCLIAAMIIFGTIGVFVRGIPLPSTEIALYRVVLGTVLVAMFLLISRKGFDLPAVQREWYLLIPSGAMLGFNWIFLFEAYRHTTVSIATLSYYFAPIIVTLLSTLLFKEKLTARQLRCFVYSTIGLVLCTGIGNTTEKSGHLLGIALGLAAAMLYAFVVLLNKRMTAVQGIQRTFWQFVFAAVVLTPYVLCTGGFSLHKLNGLGLLALLTVGIVHSGIAYCLYFSTINRLRGQQVALLSYIDPLIAILVSVTILSEPLSLLQGIGAGLILLGMLGSELKSKKSQ